MKKQFSKAFFILFSLLMLLACSKDDAPKTPETALTPVVRENVKIIDATKLQLDVTPTQIENGVYQFTFSGTAPNITIGDVIVGEQGNGFLRKVTSIVVNGNTITLQTTQGAMSDVFKEGGFNFDLDMSDMKGRTTTNGFSYTITNQSIYEEGPLSIVLDNGQVDFNPNWFLDFNFDKTGIKSFEISAKNGTLNGNFTATVTASQAITLVDKSSSILTKPFTKSYTKWVPATLFGLPVLVPVTVIMKLDLVVDYSANINAAISREATFTSNNAFSLGLNYSNGQWNDINSFSPSNNFNLSKRTGNANATINLALTPKVSFKLYDQAGPYASVSLKEQLSGSVASPALDWDIKADVWLASTVGVSVAILDYTLADYSKSWETSKLSYYTPYKIEKISGDGQSGNFGQQLATPLKVRVVDNLDKIQSKVPVYFTVVSGGGTVLTTSVVTDDNGFAETTWKLGTSGAQKVDVSAKKANGTALLNSPISFTATTSSLCDDTSTSFPTVTIGSQTWMQKNLNICKYRNGDDIPQVQDPTEWASLTTGAWCYYGNISTYGATYGKLYNWYAINDPRGFAPQGYHVPSDAEWTIMTTFLGGETDPLVGNKMKAIGWDQLYTNPPPPKANNSSGFTGLPGGIRSYGGTFSGVSNAGSWWSSTEYENYSVSAWARGLTERSFVLRSSSGKTLGLSVRCVKD